MDRPPARMLFYLSGGQETGNLFGVTYTCWRKIWYNLPDACGYEAYTSNLSNWPFDNQG